MNGAHQELDRDFGFRRWGRSAALGNAAEHDASAGWIEVRRSASDTTAALLRIEYLSSDRQLSRFRRRLASPFEKGVNVRYGVF